MIKRKRTPFYQALNELDKDLKNIVKFNIKEQSLEIMPFSNQQDESLKIFYTNNNLVFLYKYDFYYNDTPKVSLSFFDDYDNKVYALKENVKNHFFHKKLDEMDKNNSDDYGFYSRLMTSRHYNLSDEEKEIFEKKVENEIKSRNLSLELSLDKNNNFNIFNVPFKNNATGNDLKNSLYHSKINCYQETVTKEIIENEELEIKIEQIISYYKQLSEKLEKIIKEFISYRVLKSMPKKYFNL